MAAYALAATPLAGASLMPFLTARPQRARLAALPPTWRLNLARTGQLSPGSPRARSVRCLAAGGALNPEMRSTLDKVVGSHKVVLFMKGTKDFPQCGFSHTVVQILRSLDVPFETLDVLSNEALRQGLKEYSSWPTFPQLYIDGEFFGGCDITLGGWCTRPEEKRVRAHKSIRQQINTFNFHHEAYKSGELQETLEKAMSS